MQGKGDQPGNFLYLDQAAQKKGGFPIPSVSKQPIPSKASHDIVRVDILPEEVPCSPADNQNSFLSPPMAHAGEVSIEK